MDQMSLVCSFSFLLPMMRSTCQLVQPCHQSSRSGYRDVDSEAHALQLCYCSLGCDPVVCTSHPHFWQLCWLLTQSLTHNNSLDAFHDYYVNKYADHHMHEIVFWYSLPIFCIWDLSFLLMKIGCTWRFDTFWCSLGQLSIWVLDLEYI